MNIYYGISGNTFDVTDICYNLLKYNNVIIIPSGDIYRYLYFKDPCPGILKTVFIKNNQDNTMIEYDETHTIKINIINNTVESIQKKYIDVDLKLGDIHSNLEILYGSLKEELPEQKMVVRYLTGNEKVLEIGGNIGRNSLVISKILGNDNSKNFVSLECDKDIAKQLKENRDLNNMNFHIESSALSIRKLIQIGWDTIVSDILLEGYKNVDIISYSELCNKYNIIFDTLIIDCEGAFYYILIDMPEILNNINLIIMENDYWDISKKKYIDEILKNNNFYIDYVEPGGWGPCINNFYEVWKKNN
jgi:FkbM family methyltransferase